MGGRFSKRRERRRVGREAKRLVRTQWRKLLLKHARIMFLAGGTATAGSSLEVAVSSWLGAHPFLLGYMGLARGSVAFRCTGT